MTNATMMVRMADAQAKVTGRYYGVSFTGTVVSSRQLYWGPDYPEQVTIKCDSPITVLGLTRDEILMNSRQLDEAGMEIKAI